MSKTVPGPLPEDGARIHVQDVMDRFVGGTRVFDFNTENFNESSMTFLISASEAPPIERTVRGALWFERGAGILKQWLPRPTDSGVTGAWIAASVRKEMLLQARHPVNPGEIIWSDPSPSEYKAHSSGSVEFLYSKWSGAEHTFLSEGIYTADSSATAAAHWEDMKLRPVPPFFVATETAQASNFFVATELGFVRAQYTGATNAKYGCFREGANVPYLTALDTDFATATNVRLAQMADSAPEAQTMIVFFHQGPSNLCR